MLEDIFKFHILIFLMTVFPDFLENGPVVSFFTTSHEFM